MESLNLPKKVFLKEVGPRDGLQIEKVFTPTNKKIIMCNLLSECGFDDMQFTAFVHPKAVPNMADSVEVSQKIMRKPGMMYSALVPNKRGYINAAAAGIKKVEMTMSATESHSISNLNCNTSDSLRTIQECLDLGLDIKLIVGLAVTFGCPFEGRPKFERITSIVKELNAMEIREVGLCDTSGVADPRQVYDFSSRLIDSFPDITFYFHAHNTHGTGLANVLAAMQAGIINFDTSIAGLGGCPYAPGASGNLATEDVAQTLKYMDIETGLDIDKLIEASKFAAETVGHHDSATLRAGKMNHLVECGPVMQKNNRKN